MDHHIAAAPSKLIDALRFDLKSTAPYILSRRSVTMYPQGASVLSPTGVNMARITLGGQDLWIDPATIRCQFTCVNNDATKSLQPISWLPNCLFQRARVMIGGTVLEDVQAFNRWSQLNAAIIEPSDWAQSEAVMGFGGTLVQDLTSSQGTKNHPKACSIPAGGQLTVQMRLPLGIIKANKMLSQRFAAPTFEFYLEQAANCLQVGSSWSSSFTLQNFCIKADLLELDSSVENAYYKALLSGQNLSFSYQTPWLQLQSVPSGATSLAISLVRAYTRLNSIFTSFQGAGSPVTDFSCPFPAILAAAGTDSESMTLTDPTTTFQVAIDSRLFPEVPASSVAEFYSMLEKACQTHASYLNPLAIDRYDYMSSNFVHGVALARVIPTKAEEEPAGFSGLNTRSGSLIRLSWQNLSNSAIQNLYTFLVAEAVCVIGEQGAFVYD